ncbi:hypothetical protein [Aulosira sp. FACHB-615]|uniref:hypothetical protein n=1 Tax=Aulosira sp. FACHB-615 TaxID=2692777 RepID=UPI0016881ABC|nr:hypothetical protein [Aulosira sp. FACHB-615]MBD2492179.1 hypothetical protein [Aulosira sp. FACHB-615]
MNLINSNPFNIDSEQSYLVVHPRYAEIAKDAISGVIIGGYHYDYLDKQKLPSLTVHGVYIYLGGIKPKRTVKQILEKFTKDGWLNKTELSAHEAKKLITAKQPQDLLCGQLVCEWCKAKTLILDRHHYPVPKSKGGDKIVNICPNCHQEFHQLVRTASYHPSDKLIQFFRSVMI